MGRLGDTCQICCNAFEKVTEFAEEIARNLEGYEYRSFQVGSRVRGSLKTLLELLKFEEAELKRAFNRLLARELERVTGRKQSLKPDVAITFDLEDFTFEITVLPVYIYGRYVKRVRNISQTRWICKVCGGVGCDVCNYTGKKYVSSVEELIATPVIDLFKARDAILHGAGREDVDARMLGNGRPFVLEIVEPRRRYIAVEEVEKAVNEYCKGKVAVRNLRYAEAKDVRVVKEEKFKKKYRAKVVFGGEVDEGTLREALKKLVGKINQRTPRRVLHRRADKLRIKNLYDVKLLLLRKNVAVIEFEAEAGLYIKELVSGDDGRTEPSLSSVLGIPARVEKLDVVEVY